MKYGVGEVIKTKKERNGSIPLLDVSEKIAILLF
jgi:hypothetical protein